MSALLQKTSGILDSSQQASRTQLGDGQPGLDSAKINTGQGTVGALVNDKQLYNNLEQTTSSMQATMVQAQTGVTDFAENMEALKHNFFLRGYFRSVATKTPANWRRMPIDRLPEQHHQGVHLSGEAAFDKQIRPS